MRSRREDVVREFTELVLASIAAEDAKPYRPKRQTLVTLSVRMPVAQKRLLERRAKRRGIEQTQLVLRSIGPILELLEREDPSDERQASLFRREGETARSVPPADAA